MRKAFIFFISIPWCVLSCSQPNNAPQIKIKKDTLFLDKTHLNSKYWAEYDFNLNAETTIAMKFINDTVVKYYIGKYGCWNENYNSWFKAYDCFRIYNDTIETIDKLVQSPKNENKYELSPFDWPRKYCKFKFYIDPFNNDTVLSIDDGVILRKYHTLSAFKIKYKINYPILFD